MAVNLVKEAVVKGERVVKPMLLLMMKFFLVSVDCHVFLQVQEDECFLYFHVLQSLVGAVAVAVFAVAVVVFVDLATAMLQHLSVWLILQLVSLVLTSLLRVQTLLG